LKDGIPVPVIAGSCRSAEKQVKRIFQLSGAVPPRFRRDRRPLSTTGRDDAGRHRLRDELII
jgi:hypothetical protein